VSDPSWSVQLRADNAILLDGQDTGLKLTQRASVTVVFTPTSVVTGSRYLEHPLPHAMYSLTHPSSASDVPGVIEFERDLRVLLAQRKATE
jgi:hypothetical protein